MSEAVGTFCLVFAGTGAIIVNELQQGVVTHAGISLVFGLVVAAMILALGPISGAHLNPAVTLAFAVGRRMAWREVPGYVMWQFGGALMASLALRALFPASTTLGATLPSGGAVPACVLEVILTFMLMLVILGVSSGSRECGVQAAVAVGGVVALDALMGGPVSGASMNPARSLAPALISGRLEHWWVYVVGPVAGALAAVGCWALISPRRSERA